MKEDNDERFEPENMYNFAIPESFLKRLYDFTGSSTHDRGFCLAYVDQSGQVMVMQKAETQIIDLGLRKGLEKFLIEMEESEGRVDIQEGED